MGETDRKGNHDIILMSSVSWRGRTLFLLELLRWRLLSRLLISCESRPHQKCYRIEPKCEVVDDSTNTAASLSRNAKWWMTLLL
jgi:hypothetical protein